jgi:anti-anti-sigma factor
MKKLVTTIHWELKDDVVEVSPLGDALSFRQSDLIQDVHEIEKFMRDNAKNKVLVDFSRKDYFGSIVIGAISSIGQTSRELGGQMVLCNASPAMQEILSVMKITDIWPSFPEKKHALKVLKAWK